MTTDDFKCGVYQHYKGDTYRAIVLARLEKDGEEGEFQVVYIALNGKSHIWIRPFSEFTGTVVYNKQEQPRFQFLHS